MEAPLPLPSNRSFGATFVVVFAIVGAWSWWRGGAPLGWMAACGFVLAVTLVAPGVLTPFNRAWMKLAEILNRLVSPVVLGVMYFGLFAPIGWAMRRAGRDALRRSIDPAARTYWLERDPPGPDPAGMPNQF